LALTVSGKQARPALRRVGQVLVFEGEMVIEWKSHDGYGYDHSYALVFSWDGKSGIGYA